MIVIKKIFNKLYGSFVNTYRGIKELKTLIRSKKEDEIFLILSNQLGDCVYGMAYADSLKKKKGKKLVVFSDENRRTLLESYHVDARFVYLNKNSREWKDMQCLNGSPYCVRKGLKHDIYNVVQWVLYPMSKFSKDDAHKLIRENMFGLDDSASIIYPKLSGWPIHSIDNFESQKQKIAVINPYSISMNRIDYTLFDEMSEMLSNNGYIVYTNVIKDQKAVKGSHKLNCSIEEFYAICNQIPIVVSVRSGIIDVAISAHTNFFVVYFLKEFGKLGKGFLGQYTLQSWQTHNATEVVYEDQMQVLDCFKNFIESIK